AMDARGALDAVDGYGDAEGIQIEVGAPWNGDIELRFDDVVPHAVPPGVLAVVRVDDEGRPFSMDVELDAIEAVAAGVPHRFDRDLILVGGGDRYAARKRLHAERAVRLESERPADLFGLVVEVIAVRYRCGCNEIL